MNTASASRDMGSRILSLGLVIGSLVLLALIVVSSFEMSLAAGLRSVTSTLWGWTTLFDLYLGFFIFGVWIVHVERSKPRAACWIVAMLATGNLAVAVFGIFRLRRCSTVGEFFGGVTADPAPEK